MIGLLHSASKTVAVLLVLAAALLLVLACADGLGSACADACCRPTGQGSPFTSVLRRLLSGMRAMVSAPLVLAEPLADRFSAVPTPADPVTPVSPAALRI